MKKCQSHFYENRKYLGNDGMTYTVIRIDREDLIIILKDETDKTHTAFLQISGMYTKDSHEVAFLGENNEDYNGYYPTFKRARNEFLSSFAIYKDL